MNIFAWNPFTKLLTIDLLNVVLHIKLMGHEFNEFNYLECIFIMTHFYYAFSPGGL
jgi:hypothetical protein